jgi:hypothetical protein
MNEEKRELVVGSILFSIFLLVILQLVVIFKWSIIIN